MIRELPGVGEVGDAPAVEVVFSHALLSESLELLGIAGTLSPEQTVTSDLFGGASVIDLIKLVPAAELGGQAVPQELHQLDALLGFVAVGAAQVAIEVGAHLRILEVTRVAVEINESGGNGLLNDVLYLRVGHGCEYLIGIAWIHIRQNILADPGLGIPHHRVRQPPE